MKNKNKKIQVKVDSTAGWPDQGMLYISNDTTIPDGIYLFKRSKSKAKVLTPIYLKEYKNRVSLSKKTIKDIENNL